MSLREKIFWYVDALKGGQIKKHHNEIKSIIEFPESDASVKAKNKNLNKILNHAINSTPFYKKYEDFKSIQDFPIIKKTVVQDNFEDFKSKDFIDNKLFKVSTSGSTGVPFFLFHNKNKRNRNTADVIYFAKLAGYTIGTKLLELEVWRNHNKKNSIKAFIQNVEQFDITRLDKSRVQVLFEKLKSNKAKKNILGFSSALETICQNIDVKDINIDNANISSIIANSEYLNPYVKETLGKHLNTNVLSRYSSEEVGIIAHQTLNSPNEFTLNHASYYVEILNLDNDEPAKPGTSGRLVITDLFNYSMPLIRYDTGDIAVASYGENGVLKLKHIEGRKMDLIYDTKGNLLSSFMVYTKFYNYYKFLNQYQFIQKGEKSYTIKLNPKGEFKFESKLISLFKEDLGADANIKVEYVEEVPPLSSGKRRKVVNEYHKQ